MLSNTYYQMIIEGILCINKRLQFNSPIHPYFKHHNPNGCPIMYNIKIFSTDNWRELYLGPLIEHSHLKPLTDNMDQRRIIPPIKCIRSDIKLVAGETDERLLHSVSFGCKEELEDEKPLVLKDK